MKYITLILITLSLNGCLTGGTHGSIKVYMYNCSKDDLRKAVEKVISENPNVHKDATKNYVIDITEGKNDTIIDERHNDGINYVTIGINNSKVNGGIYTFVFQYSEENGTIGNSQASDLSIAYAYDEKQEGGSEGSGNFPWYKSQPKKKLTELFEKEIIFKLDSLLGQKHKSSD